MSRTAGLAFTRVLNHPLWVTSTLYAAHAFVAMAYEVLWIKQLTLTLGMSLSTFGAVLALFIAGTGVGGYGIALIGRRFRLPIKAGFVGLQWALGLIGLILPWAIAASSRFYDAMAAESDGVLHGVAELSVAMLLLPPAVLIGAAFPLLAEGSKRSARDIPLRGPGTLYFVGLSASGLGALLPLLTIPRFGLTESSRLLGIINLLIGVSAICLKEPPAFDTNRLGLVSSSAPIPAWALLGLGGLIGFLLLGMEVIGARYLWLIANTTPYTEGIVVSVALLGMAGGSFLAVVGLRHNISPVGLCVAGIAGACVYQIVLIPASFQIAQWFDLLLHPTPRSEIYFLMTHATLAAVVVGIPALAYGVALPALIELASVKSWFSFDAIGRFWAWHNWGAMAGTLSVTFLLIPGIGLTLSLAGLSMLGIIVAVLTVTPHATRFTRVALAAVAIVAISFTLFIVRFGDLTFREAYAGAGERVIFHHEDGLGVVEVLEDQVSGHRALLSNRLKQEGETRSHALMIQRIEGYLPLLLHERPVNILVVGLGTGISLGPMIREDVGRVTVVEISRGIWNAAPLFADAQGPILSHPKVTRIEDDGRRFIRRTRERYDLIIQDLFFPYQSGVGTLYTLEHYQRCRNRLAPGGMMAQWIPLKQLGHDGFRSLVRTFHEVFPHTTVWLNENYLLILGGLQPLQIHLPEFISRHDDPDLLGGVSSVVSNPFELLGRFVVSGTALREWAATAQLNTEESSFIEYDTPRHFFTLNSVALLATNLTPLVRLHQPLTKIVRAESQEDLEKLNRITLASRRLFEARVAMGEGRLEQAIKLYEKSHTLHPWDRQVRSFLGQD